MFLKHGSHKNVIPVYSCHLCISTGGEGRLCFIMINDHQPRSLEHVLLRYYSDVIMSAMASQITRPLFVYSSVYSVADQRKHQSFASLTFVWGIHRWPVNSSHKGPVTRKMFHFDDVIMTAASQVIVPIIGTLFQQILDSLASRRPSWNRKCLAGARHSP